MATLIMWPNLLPTSSSMATCLKPSCWCNPIETLLGRAMAAYKRCIPNSAKLGNSLFYKALPIPLLAPLPAHLLAPASLVCNW